MNIKSLRAAISVPVMIALGAAVIALPFGIAWALMAVLRWSLSDVIAGATMLAFGVGLLAVAVWLAGLVFVALLTSFNIGEGIVQSLSKGGRAGGKTPDESI